MATILKSAGLTLTTSRIDILYHLTQTSIPCTASELSKLLDIPLSTTHRNLSVLACAGLANYIIDRSGVSRWFLLVKGKTNFCPCCNQEYRSVCCT
ncbi:helix-turn-helix domain-containing protein [Candidatus Symbiopectobacterium sp. NZEC151]|nr:helix-turn-helix domain-containing protein [Candidatus Symbiopectobacterium sp. NZEC151]MCW2482336.1 helix-turn-helix domain-containing protein [Candidatus Symbiopectobacterium sp. NZEC135]